MIRQGLLQICLALSSAFCSIHCLIALEEPQADQQLTVHLNVKQLRKYVTQWAAVDWLDHPDLLRMVHYAQLFERDAGKRYGPLPPFQTALSSASRFSLNWRLEVPVFFGPETRTDTWFFQEDSAQEQKQADRFWMNEAFQESTVNEQAGRMWHPQGVDVESLRVLDGDSEATWSLRLNLRSDDNSLLSFAEIMASYFPYVAFPNGPHQALSIESLRSDLFLSGSQVTSKTFFGGLKAADYGAYNVAWRRADSDASLAMPLAWGVSLFSAMLSYRALTDGNEGDWAEVTLGAEHMKKFSQAPWKALFADWIYGEFWWEGDRGLLPDGVVILPLRGQDPKPMTHQDLNIFFGDIERVPFPEHTVWKALDYSFYIIADHNSLVLASSIASYQQYLKASILPPDEPAQRSLFDLRISSWRLRKLLAYWLWDDNLSFHVGPRLPVFMLDVLRSVPSKALHAKSKWWYYIPRNIRQFIAAFEASQRSSDAVLHESIALYNAGPRAVLSRPAVIIRTALGWYVQHGWEALQGPLDRQGLDAFTAHMTLVGETPASDLTIFNLYDPIQIDTRILPSFELLVSPSKGTYRMSLHQKDAGITAREEGLPLISVASMLSSFMYQYRQAKNIAGLREEEALQTGLDFLNDHDDEREAITAISLALKEFQADHQELPIRFSRLIERNYLDLDLVLPLFQQLKNPPLTAKEIDDLGIWNPHDAAGILWECPVHPEWELWLNSVSQFGLRPRVPLPVENRFERW